MRERRRLNRRRGRRIANTVNSDERHRTPLIQVMTGVIGPTV
jgi:hypothetical protein